MEVEDRAVKPHRFVWAEDDREVDVFRERPAVCLPVVRLVVMALGSPIRELDDADARLVEDLDVEAAGP